MDNKTNDKPKTAKEIHNEEQILIAKGIKKAIQDIAITPSGKLFFHWLMKECGFTASSIAYGKDDKIDKDGLLINEALRRMYLNMRKHIPNHILPEVEYLEVSKHIVEQMKLKKGE